MFIEFIDIIVKKNYLYFQNFQCLMFNGFSIRDSELYDI